MLILLTSTAAEKTDQKITVADSSSQSTSGPSRPTTVSVRSEKDEAEEWPVREMIAILGLGLKCVFKCLNVYLRNNNDNLDSCWGFDI